MELYANNPSDHLAWCIRTLRQWNHMITHASAGNTCMLCCWDELQRIGVMQRNFFQHFSPTMHIFWWLMVAPNDKQPRVKYCYLECWFAVEFIKMTSCQASRGFDKEGFFESCGKIPICQWSLISRMLCVTQNINSHQSDQYATMNQTHASLCLLINKLLENPVNGIILSWLVNTEEWSVITNY